MTEHMDPLELRHPTEREAQQFTALQLQLAFAAEHAPAMAQLLKGVDFNAVTDRASLAKLPVTRKSDLQKLQAEGRAQNAANPFGGFATALRGPKVGRIFASPGPIYEPEGRTPDYWRMARALHAAGFREGDLVHNSFSYHMTPGAYLMESAAHALGCTVFPGGVGQTDQQLQAMADLQPNAYSGTPSFLKLLVEKAAEIKQPMSVKKALVSGEAFPPSLRDWMTQRGIDAYQAYGTADVGLIAYETRARQGLVCDERVIVEIVRPGTGDPVPEGEVGEVVVTVLNELYPLLRFGTGDLSAVMSGDCPTGRTAMRINGWMGRADQTTKIRGMFVHPGQVAEVVKRFPEITRARLVVTGQMAQDEMTFKVEASSCATELQGMIAQAVRDVTKLRADVQMLEVGSLPNDGKVIEDARSYK